MGGVAAYFLLGEHRAHFLGALPLLLLAGPLMHVFMHHGHGRHSEAHAHQPDAEQGSTPAAKSAATGAEERP
jgi:hypothetical protein